MPTPLIDMQNVPAPSGNPSSGRTFLYVNSSTKLPYWKTDSGTVLRAFFNPSSVDADVVPDAANSRDLGSSAKPWRSLYLRGDLSMKDGYNIPFGEVGSVFSVQWSHSYIGIGSNTYNDPSGPQLKHLSHGASAQFLLFDPHEHRLEYHVHEPSTTSPGPGQNVVYTTPRLWVNRDGDMEVLRDVTIKRHLNVQGNTTLGNAHDDSTTVNGSLTLSQYPRAGGYLNGENWGSAVSTLPLGVVYGSDYVSGNVFTVPPNCGGMYRVGLVTMVVKDNNGTHVAITQIVINAVPVAQADTRLSVSTIATAFVAWQGYVGAGSTIKFAIGQAHGDCYVVGTQSKTQWWIERIA